MYTVYTANFRHLNGIFRSNLCVQRPRPPRLCLAAWIRISLGNGLKGVGSGYSCVIGGF